jgi:hypothetical protein
LLLWLRRRRLSVLRITDHVLTTVPDAKAVMVVFAAVRPAVPVIE